VVYLLMMHWSDVSLSGTSCVSYPSDIYGWEMPLTFNALSEPGNLAVNHI
jgi:hypothetical protein